MCKMLKKLKWQKPMLTILIRGKPEEHVLFTCKGVDFGSASIASRCGTGFGGVRCSDCVYLGAS